ncbi:MAG: DUF2752 domain-containing protein [Bacteroidia bacterium]|nr:DUF2752 domain-containing protein [Bacteroidia bacterium]
MRWIELVFRFGVLIAPALLLILPADFFDYGPPICPSRLLLNVECPGCGLTRGTQHLLHLEWEKALDYNPLVLITTPILAWLWVKNLLYLYLQGFLRPATLPKRLTQTLQKAYTFE